MHENTIDIAAEVEPACVGQGETIRLTIRTDPDLLVIYQAVYAGEEGGAPPPLGSGHGGSHGGNTGSDGVYTSEWTVSPSAPVGKARVEIFAAENGRSDQRGHAAIPFEVRSAASTSC